MSVLVLQKEAPGVSFALVTCDFSFLRLYLLEAVLVVICASLSAHGRSS